MGSLLLAAGTPTKDMRFSLRIRDHGHQPRAGSRGGTDIMACAGDLNLKKAANELYVKHTGKTLGDRGCAGARQVLDRRHGTDCGMSTR